MWVKKAFLPIAAGHKRCLCGTRASGRNVAKMDQRSPDKWSCSMLQRKVEKLWSPVPICLGENSFLTPGLVISYSLSIWARPVSSSHSPLVTPSRKCPSPILSQPEAISWPSKKGQMPWSWSGLGARILPKHSGCYKVLRPRDNISGPHFLWLLPVAL